MKKKEILVFVVLSIAFSIMMYSCGDDRESRGICYIPSSYRCIFDMSESECDARGGYLTYLCPIIPFDISGNWNFYLAADGIESESINLTLDQSGNDFNGVYTCDQTDTNINGTVTDSNVSFMTIDKSFSFTGVVNGNCMSGTWVAINGTSSGTWRADRNED